MDITDPASLTVLGSLAVPGTVSTGCNANLAGDSWVPSNGQLPQSSHIINCTVSSGNTGTATTCSSGLTSTAGGCSGCMDSSETLFRYMNTANSIPGDLATRYGSSCTFNTRLNNVWNNYYKLKTTALGPTISGTASTSGVYPRGKTVESDITTLNSTVDPGLTNLFANVNTNLAGINNLLDPTFGVIAGFNCTVLGEDALRIRGTACGNTIDHMYLTRLATGIVSYLLFAALCCIVCFGNRHARMMDDEDQNGTFGRQEPYTNNPYTNGGQSA